MSRTPGPGPVARLRATIGEAIPDILRTLIVQARSGDMQAAKPLIDREKYPSMHANDGWEARIRALVAAELANKVQAAETIENPATARLPDESGG